MLRRGFAPLSRDLAILVVAMTGLLAVTGRSDWPFLAVSGALGLCAGAFVVLNRMPLKLPLNDPANPGPPFLGIQAEETFDLRAILNALPDPVLVLDDERQIRIANAAARSLLGSDIEERSLLAVLRQPALLAALDSLARGEDPSPFDLPDIGGHALTAEIVPVQGQEAGTEPVQSLIVFHEVSGQRRAETLRSDFVANVSHELKTPLATLIGFLETLKGPARNDEQARARFLDIMLAEAQRMSRIVADLLSLSRIELNEYQSPEGRANLQRLVSSVVEGLALKAKQRGIVVQLPAPGCLPTVPGDPDELTQVLQNLIDNALKYSRDQAMVTVTAEIITDRALLRLHLPQPRAIPAAVAISVRDQGPGIAREHIPRLTERFYRVDTARSREMGGTGLGLAIVKHIINRHRGKLEVQSVLGEGSIFTIYLPMDAIPQEVSPAAA